MDSLKELIYECPKDLRIANYFSRKHVTTVGVLDIIDVDDNYVECMQTESFQAYDCEVPTQWAMPWPRSLEGSRSLLSRGGDVSQARTSASISAPLASGCSRRIRWR
jgi:hypothetical protein